MHYTKHRNITFKRMAFDFYQFFRSQSPLTKYFGPQYTRSQKYIELDITYQCNLKCINCNRSCSQAPSKDQLSVRQVNDFIKDSIQNHAKWERIRLLGGEPTLHPNLFKIINLLLDYKKNYLPSLRIVLCTNGFGKKVNSVLEKLPKEVIIKNTLKHSNYNLFRPFNVAPVDSIKNIFADYSSGCRIIAECGLGLTPSGYYPCAVAGGIDRIFHFNLGKPTLPAPDDLMLDQLKVLCRLCGHFGFSLPTKTRKMSSIWSEAYKKYNKKN
jgi:hypothetical protein